MAMVQTAEAARCIQEICPDVDVKVIPFSTAGDLDQKSKLRRYGGKGGAFIGQIREALLSGQVDVVMHSLKDMPGNEETPTIVIGAYLTRESPFDALVARPGLSADEFRRNRGRGCKVGTNSVRRAAYVRRLFPEAEIMHYRGAATTRIAKLDSLSMQQLSDGGEVGPADVLIMAVSGMERISLADRVVYTFEPEEMLPSVGQGIVALECREKDWEMRALIEQIDNHDARTCALAEREVLWILNGHCNSPIAGYARIYGQDLELRAALISEDGKEMIEASSLGKVSRPREVGRSVALDLIHKGANRIIEQTRES
jgi:hydroxymethylbilane synthase